MHKLRTALLCALALTAQSFLPGCASKGEGEASLTWTERWKAMRERQDAAARANVSNE